MNVFFAGLIIGVIILFLLKRKSSPKKNSNEQLQVAQKIHNFIRIRKSEIFTNVMDASMWRLEMEMSILIVEAKNANLFPVEILKKLAPYTHLEMFLDIDNEVARKEIVELEKYFSEFVN